MTSSIFKIANLIVLYPLIRKGKPEKGIENTTTLIEKNIFRCIRHPLYLGFSFWAIGQILYIQTFFSAISGCVAVFLAFIASKKEDQFNIIKFGDSYRNYMKRVPKWNIFKRH